MQPRTRAAMLRFHRWLGLALTPLLLLQALTGVALVFRDEIEAVLHPELLVEAMDDRLPVELLAKHAQNVRPEARLDRLTFATASDRAAIARLKLPSGAFFFVALDPYRGTVLHSGAMLAWPAEVLFGVHHELVAGKVGNRIIGFEGIALTLLIIFGFMAWWPGSRRLRQGFRIVPGTTDRLVRTLHRSAGGVLAVALLIIATTGVGLVFKAQIGAVIGAVPKPAPKVAARPDVPLLSLDEVVARARALVGHAPLVELRLSGEAGQIAAVHLDDQHSLRLNAVDQILIGRYTGRMVGRYQPARLPAPNGVLDWTYTIHTGQALGLTGQLLALTSGIALLLFAGSGFWLWLSRSRQGRTRRTTRSALSGTELARFR